MIHSSLETLLPYVEGAKKEGKTIVRTNGCFDIVHPGHIETLLNAKSLGDILIVGMNGDASPYWETKPGRPINCENNRAILLDAIRYVDHVIIFQEDTPYTIIKAIVPHVMLKGADYSDITTIAGHDIVLGNGGKIVIDKDKRYSTSDIVRKIRQLPE